MSFFLAGKIPQPVFFWARNLLTDKGDTLNAVTFDYGQRHRIEIESARKVASMANVDSHEVIEVPNCLRSVSPLTSEHELEKYENYEQMEHVIGSRVELTFVPMCNTLFLTIAANRAVALGCNHIVIGVCEQDGTNYPDCRQSFLSQMEEAINQSLGLQRQERIKILAPS
ncbi:7-cyano-7-deazaguanine synthase [Sinorhizobium psoraleae]|uniref:7-cyano-7-deazaguanine synthase n=1 Tax=Sinorhizobium psoraleae TaxID=520838 RepID=A0ABT4KNL7_9HYPH|nr:7-cyano-7-deazaguanine synthase [Sinorhizobium psoraleae]MCZ4093563.1 7-cyano-7-deazaguanine synthase [Sinorhizobium psoraleae]